jgi:Zn-dependent M28 family amino/carboxypeptidase
MFVAFSAEEMGLLGSKYFTEHLPVPQNNIVAMINLDMIGRLDTLNNSIFIGGVGTSVESKLWLTVY